ncbi:MAG: formylglycine-generating enzyme family protein [Proteobacteria bacterium]|nr:formylglycine-generating enzyme family protein [Pseudomonadota bacterium]
MDALIPAIWDVDDDPVKIKAKRRNFTSIKSSINTDLEKLSQKGMNLENITIAEANIFDMTEEAKSNLLNSFTDAVKTGDINLDQATNLLKAVTDFLDQYQQNNLKNESNDIVEQIKKILNKITEEVLSEEELASTPGLRRLKTGEHKFEDSGTLEEALEEIGELDEDVEEIELEENEDIEEIELDEDETLEEIGELDEDAEEIELEENEDIEEIELDEDEALEEIDELDEDVEEIELDENEDIEEIELDEDETLEEIDELDEDAEEIELEENEDIEEIELDEDETLEEIDELDEDAEEIELDENEDIEEIELDEDEALEDAEDLEEIDDSEELEEVDGLTEDELKALDEFRKKKELAEHFDQTLGDREKKYNKYTTVPEGNYTIGTKKSLKSSLELQQFHMPRVYIGIYPVTNALFEIFIEQTGYVTTAEKTGYGRVYSARFKKGTDTSAWSKQAGSQDVKGATWFEPSGPGSTLHQKRNHPVVQVSVKDAHAFASWIGRRLPTEPEWESAARTDLGNKYPWGNTFNPDALNIEQTGLSDTSPVDEFDEFANEFKIADMLGNVMEWTSDLEYPPIKSKKKTKYCVAKGAAWNSKNDVSISSRALFKPGFTSNIIGFRCLSEIFL